MAFNLADFPEAFAKPEFVTELSAWHEHIPMAPILVKLLRPRIFVELGTHMGDSYIAFCNAVKVLDTGTLCTAVDTWQGDAHAGGYGPEVLKTLREYHDPRYGRFSRLLQGTFDAAAPEFPDGSIDLLHIDGMHTYEAVRHDYLNWLPKMSPRGVVVFHDTAERGLDFGVWKLWEEVAAGKPHASVPYGYGLGILAVGPEQPAAFLEFLEELNQKPGLVEALKALGKGVDLYMNARVVVMHLFHCRLYLNVWLQRTGHPIADPTPNYDAAWGDQLAFGEVVAKDVQQLAIDGLNLVTEVSRLRAVKG